MQIIRWIVLLGCCHCHSMPTAAASVVMPSPAECCIRKTAFLLCTAGTWHFRHWRQLRMPSCLTLMPLLVPYSLGIALNVIVLQHHNCTNVSCSMDQEWLFACPCNHRLQCKCTVDQQCHAVLLAQWHQGLCQGPYWVQCCSCR